MISCTSAQGETGWAKILRPTNDWKVVKKSGNVRSAKFWVRDFPGGRDFMYRLKFRTSLKAPTGGWCDVRATRIKF